MRHYCHQGKHYLLRCYIVSKHQREQQDITQFDKFGRLDIDAENTKRQIRAVNDIAPNKHDAQSAEPHKA